MVHLISKLDGEMGTSYRLAGVRGAHPKRDRAGDREPEDNRRHQPDRPARVLRLELDPPTRWQRAVRGRGEEVLLRRVQWELSR